MRMEANLLWEYAGIIFNHCWLFWCVSSDGTKDKHSQLHLYCSMICYIAGKASSPPQSHR